VNRKNGKRPRESERHVEAVAKTLSILECFTHSEPELSLKEPALIRAASYAYAEHLLAKVF
jgi:hypothetical protein